MKIVGIKRNKTKCTQKQTEKAFACSDSTSKRHRNDNVMDSPYVRN